MPLLLFVAFLVMPLVELAVILKVGGAIGAGWTILLLVADSVAGAVIVRREGRRAWRAFRQALAEHRWPGDEVVQGALVLVGGALLLTPGFVTDAIGLASVLPPSRAVIARFLRTRVSPVPLQVVDLGAEQVMRMRADGPAAAASNADVLEVEVVAIEPDIPPTGDEPAS